MSDFILSFDPSQSPEPFARHLRDRPGMETRSTERFHFPWGWVVAQAPPSFGYDPWQQDSTLLVVCGRPRLIGVEHETTGAHGFAKALHERWRSGREADLFASLTGTYALLKATDEGVTVLTDQMGAFPVYIGHGRDGVLAGVGTSVDFVAQLSERLTDWDAPSLAELLVFNNITFPFTTRQGVSELPPATLSEICDTEESMKVSTSVFWKPYEPTSWLSDAAMTDQIEQAVRESAIEISRGSRNTAVTLSGGLDSRAVLASMPDRTKVTALTFVTHENNETRIAQQVANAAKVEHKFAQRDEDFYAKISLERGLRLLGSELRAVIHGFAITDNLLADKFDIIIGGHLSDTFLKHHFMPFSQREKFRRRGMRENAGRVARSILGRPSKVNGPSISSTIGRHLALNHLSPDVRQVVCERRRKRLDQVKEIRPETAHEWVRFWPTSRQDDLADVLGSLRLFPFDTLFMQRAIIEAAVSLNPKQRYSGRVANNAFVRIYGELGNILNANTGRPASGPQATAKQKRNATRGTPKSIANSKPWNNVQSSWANDIAIQKLHPFWTAARARVAKSPATNVLNSLTYCSAEKLLSEYDDSIPSTFNQMLVQLGVYIQEFP